MKLFSHPVHTSWEGWVWSLLLILALVFNLTLAETDPLLYRVAAAAAVKPLQSCPTLCGPIDSSPPGFPCPWDFPGKNTGVGCHFLLQCMKVKSESEFAQSCPTLLNPMDWSPPGSSDHGIFQARVLEWVAIAFSNAWKWRRSVVSDS